MPSVVERVLAIDPGEKVGWAVGEVYGGAMVDPDNPANEVSVNYLDVVDHGITPLKPFAERLLGVAGNYHTIVFENYRIYADKASEHIGSDVPTLQLIGMIRLCAWHHHVDLVYQPAARQTTGEKVATEGIKEILSRMPANHDDAHDGSALKHLSFYYWNKYV